MVYEIQFKLSSTELGGSTFCQNSIQPHVKQFGIKGRLFLIHFMGLYTYIHNNFKDAVGRVEKRKTVKKNVLENDS